MQGRTARPTDDADVKLHTTRFHSEYVSTLPSPNASRYALQATLLGRIAVFLHASCTPCACIRAALAELAVGTRSNTSSAHPITCLRSEKITWRTFAPTLSPPFRTLWCCS